MAGAVMDYNDRLSFLAQWFDNNVAYLKKFLMHFYPNDNSIELFDINCNRIFLKRVHCEGITQRDIFVGNTVRIYGRQVLITDYADERSKQLVGKTKEHTFCLLKPGVIDKLGEIIAQIEARQFQITKMRMCNLSRKEALEFYESRRGEHFLPFILEHVVSGAVVGLELVGDDAIERCKMEVGPQDPIEARRTAPQSLRALYGQERASNGFYRSDDREQAEEQIRYFFSQGNDRELPETTVKLHNSTCCIIKPHAVQEGKLGYILKDINESKFYVTAMQMFYLSNANADEFLEVYKGVVSDYNALLLSFLDGPCVVLEISTRNSDINVHEEFRKLAGPADSNIARQIRPCTLRAKFGIDKYRNAVHCTDLPEDTVLELEYFFNIVKM